MPSVYEVTGQAGEIDWAPSTEAREVLQNVRFVLSTPAGSVPLARNIGISSEVIDAPVSKARAMLMTSVYRGLRRSEPRAIVKEIYLDGTNAIDGHMRPRVRITL